MNFGIIAAGQGSRLVQEGVALPKPLVVIDGRPMIRRLIDILVRCGASRLCVIVNEDRPEVIEFLTALAPLLPCTFDLIVKSTPTSMHSFYELAKVMGEKDRYIITTVDTVFREEDFRNYAEAFETAPSEVDGMMGVTTFIDDEKPLYVAVDSDNRITGFLDTYEAGVHFVSGGIYGLGPSALPVLKRCLEAGVGRMRNYQRALVDAGLWLQAYDMNKIIDVDHAADIAKADIFLRSEGCPQDI